MCLPLNTRRGEGEGIVEARLVEQVTAGQHGDPEVVRGVGPAREFARIRWGFRQGQPGRQNVSRRGDTAFDLAEALVVAAGMEKVDQAEPRATAGGHVLEMPALRVCKFHMNEYATAARPDCVRRDLFAA